MNEHLPVAVVGAGPVGLAAAARLVERGIAPVVFERGPGSVAETKTTDDNIEGGDAGKGIRGGGETEMRERIFYFGEETRHQVGVTEDDLVDFEVV